jgi:hypothetical protein
LDDNRLCFVIQRLLSLFGYNIDNNLEPTIKFYEDCVGSKAAIQLIAKDPRVLASSLENRLKPRLVQSRLWIEAIGDGLDEDAQAIQNAVSQANSISASFAFQYAFQYMPSYLPSAEPSASLSTTSMGPPPSPTKTPTGLPSATPSMIPYALASSAPTPTPSSPLSGNPSSQPSALPSSSSPTQICNLSPQGRTNDCELLADRFQTECTAHNLAVTWNYIPNFKTLLLLRSVISTLFKNSISTSIYSADPFRTRYLLSNLEQFQIGF